MLPCTPVSVPTKINWNVNCLKVAYVQPHLSAFELTRKSMHYGEKLAPRAEITSNNERRLPSLKDNYLYNSHESLQYAIPKINMLCNLCCLKTRLRLLCNKYQRHSSLDHVSQQLKLCNMFVCPEDLLKPVMTECKFLSVLLIR